MYSGTAGDVTAGWAAFAAFSVAAIVAILYQIIVNRSRYQIPPGPIGIPLLGYLPFLGNKPFCELAKLAKIYGPLFSVRLGTRLVIVLGDFDVIKESFILKSKIFSDRPDNNPFSEMMDKEFVGYHGPEWTELSKFLDKCLKDLGTGTSTVETQILDEIEVFLTALSKKAVESGKGSVVSFHNELGVSSANNACILTFGRRFDYDDATFKALKSDQDDLTPLTNSVSWRFLFPFLTRIPGLSGSPSQSPLRAIGNRFEKFAKHIVRDHVTNPHKYRDRDFINAFLEEQKIRLQKNQIPLGAFTDSHLHGVLMALFGGGSQTVETTIAWAIAYLLHHPEWQDRLHAELDLVFGQETSASYSQRKRTPQVEAFLMEVERIASIVPINIPHSNSEEIIFRGYRIPKGSYILSNNWGVHHDPTKWTDPDKFDPERFLVGDRAVRPENLIPFSVGKRACPGEGLAKMEMYLYFVSMLQHFRFLPIDGAPLPQLAHDIDNPGIVIQCPPFQTRLIKRSA